jgi:hypothetical protein
MAKRLSVFAAVFALLVAPAAAPTASAAVTHAIATVNGVQVDRYVWLDSRNRPRSVSLKREGNGNPGHGGYAVQMTYQVNNNGRWVTVRANSPANEGFGYFVSHERYRNFTDGSYNSIARRVFNRDDSPLGRGFPVVGRRLATGNPEMAAHRFTLNYPRYGTVNPIPKNPDGSDSALTPVAPAAHRLYTLPVSIVWYFETGTDYPRIQTSVSLTGIPGPDRVDFDVRGPYGELLFDNTVNRIVDGVMWGDRYLFRTTGAPLTRNNPWTWNTAYRAGRFTALFAGGYEMGLFEPRPWTSSALAHGFANGRGRNSNVYRCTEPDNRQVLPCNWEWPYQSAQYSLPASRTTPTNGKKIAWGSAPYYGTGPSMTVVWDTGRTARPFNGFPATRRITYSVCVVLGRAIAGGLTRAAAAGPDYNCAALP